MTRHTRAAVLTLTMLCLAVQIARADTAANDPVAIAYGEHERQTLDLYPVPDANADNPSPLVIYFHGGGFNHGDKSGVSANLIKRMHDKGIAVAAANYRFITTDGLPAAMYDGTRAVQQLRRVAGEYHLDPDKIAVLGTSAGAGISLWIALHDDLAEPEAEDPVARQSTRVVCAYVKNAQVSYDPRFWREIGLDRVFEKRTFRELYRFPDEAGDTPELVALYEAASPINFLTADDPPVRLDYGFGTELSDTTSPSALIHHPNHGLAFQKACEAVGVPCVLTYTDGPQEQETGYGYLIRMLGK
ncbi:MAG: alpha/beta hydrolase [Phycisphaerales bacterium]